ncbi:MAG: MraY family glycosyltransferase [Verrucomicrobia bacterium]|nr:MraY family glycosyltransferase [Verrucomicrobiota bacterium]
MQPDIITSTFWFSVLGFVVVWILVPRIQQWNYARAMEARQAAGTGQPAVSRLGGVALVLAFVGIAVVAQIWFPAADAAKAKTRWVIIATSLAMFLLGLWDDIKPLGARKKLIGQVLIALVVCFCGVRVPLFQNPFTNAVYTLGWVGWPLTVFWLVSLTNMINLIDGIDGLAGGVTLMLMGLLTYLGTEGGLVFPLLCAAGMSGALLGFLRYNFPPAKIYMGDGGAYFLGFLIGMLTLVHSQKGTILAALIAPLFALALPIMDVALAIVRRGMKGLPIFRPDRRHIHHRLLASGFSHRRTVLTLYGASLVCLLMALSLFWTQGRLLPILCGFMFLLVLLSVRSLGLGQDWFAVDGAFGNVMRLRKETRYVLCLSRWLELEAERCGSAGELWDGYVFLVSKLGFARVKLVLAGGREVVWSRPGNLDAAEWQVRTVTAAAGNIQTMEFSAARTTMSPKFFELLTELALEAWVRAALRWEETHRQNISL